MPRVDHAERKKGHARAALSHYALYVLLYALVANVVRSLKKKISVTLTIIKKHEIFITSRKF